MTPLRYRKIILCLLSAAALMSSWAAARADAPPLRQLRNIALQAKLETTLSGLGLRTAVRNRNLSVAVVGLSQEDCPRLAAVNGDVMMYAASLPKIAIALALLRKAQDGKIKLHADDIALLHAMIRKSSNTAATSLIERAGRHYINDLLRSERYRLYDPRWGGGLWVGKPYGPEVAFQRDPLHQISHGATAIQVARFFYLLDTGQLLNSEMSQLMESILRDPGIEHKFVAGLRSRHPRTKFLRKSGTWRDYHADAALIEHDSLRYVLVGLAKSKSGEKWLRQIAIAVDEMIEHLPPPCASTPAGAR